MCASCTYLLSSVLSSSVNRLLRPLPLCSSDESECSTSRPFESLLNVRSISLVRPVRIFRLVFATKVDSRRAEGSSLSRRLSTEPLRLERSLTLLMALSIEDRNPSALSASSPLLGSEVVDELANPLAARSGGRSDANDPEPGSVIVVRSPVQ